MLAAAALAASLVAFTPVVAHDAAERYPLTSAAAHAPIAADASDVAPAVYGRAVPAGGGGAWLQYWLFYADQDQDRGIVRTGRHEADWEMVQYRLDARGRPIEAVYAQHSRGEHCGWPSVRTLEGHPLVYPAHGSHAWNLHPGTRDRLWPDPNDEADGRGLVVYPRLVSVSATSPAWMAYPGPWGHARARAYVPGEKSSPRGPAFQPDGRWSDPSAFAATTRSCQADCDAVGKCDAPEKALTGTAVAVPVATVAFILLRRRGRRGGRANGRAAHKRTSTAAGEGSE
jgi:hypothetical protein